MSAPKVFISYSQFDAEWARSFAEALRTQGVDVWFDAWAVGPGQPLFEAMEAGLRSSDAIVAILPRDSGGNPNVFFELGVALGMGKLFIPIIASEVDRDALPLGIRARQLVRMGEPEVAAREVAMAVRGKAA